VSRSMLHHMLQKRVGRGNAEVLHCCTQQQVQLMREPVICNCLSCKGSARKD
jgi:hypothetical protein